MAKIWQLPMDLTRLNAMCEGNMLSHLGIVFSHIGDDYLKASMPVTARVKQPMGLLHGGASVALAESVASCAAYCAAPQGSQVVGVDINATHLSAVRQGEVEACAKPLRLGRSMQVWQVDITQNDTLICSCRMSAMVKAPSA